LCNLLQQTVLVSVAFESEARSLALRDFDYDYKLLREHIKHIKSLHKLNEALKNTLSWLEAKEREKEKEKLEQAKQPPPP
jgi:hypothetical protein